MLQSNLNSERFGGKDGGKRRNAKLEIKVEKGAENRYVNIRAGSGFRSDRVKGNGVGEIVMEMFEEREFRVSGFGALCQE